VTTPSFDWLASDTVRGIAALIGILSVYLGYRLFCSLAGQSPSRSILFTNMASGALLASFGIGLLVSDLRGFGQISAPSHPAWQRNSSEQGTFQPEKLGVVRQQDVLI